MHYRTPYQGGAIRSWHLGIQLKSQKIDSEIITTHNRKHYEVHTIDGVKIHYLPVNYSNHFGFFKRIWAFWKFNILSWHLLKRLPRPDLLYVISTPLSIGKVGLKVKEKFKIPYVFEIGDIWPEAPVQMGVLKNRFLINYFKKLESKIYLKSKGIVSLSPAITSYLKQQTKEKPITEITNFSDIDYFGQGRGESKFQFFEEDLFVIGSVGAIGKANHLDFVVEAARYMHENNRPVGFVVMGEGSEKERLENISKGLPNIKFLKFAHQRYVRDVLHSCQAVYLSYKDVPILETGSPNRFFDALAAGKMVITNFGGWVAETVDHHHCGFQTDPHHPADLWDKLILYTQNEKQLCEAENNSLQLAEQFRPDSQVKKLSNWLKSINQE